MVPWNDTVVHKEVHGWYLAQNEDPYPRIPQIKPKILPIHKEKLIEYQRCNYKISSKKYFLCCATPYKELVILDWVRWELKLGTPKYGEEVMFVALRACGEWALSWRISSRNLLEIAQLALYCTHSSKLILVVYAYLFRWNQACSINHYYFIHLRIYF